MGFLSRRRGRRPRVIALACFGMLVATLFTLGPSALARTPSAALTSLCPNPSKPRQHPRRAPSPLAHAPGFRLAFGQQVLSGPYGVALDSNGDVWVADTGHDRVAEFAPSGRP